MLQTPVRSIRSVVMTLDAVGGVWRYGVDLAHALAREGVAVRLVGFGPRPSKVQCSSVGVDLAWEDLPLDWMPGGLDALAPARQRLLRHADRHGADILHLNSLALAHASLSNLAQVSVGHSCLPTWWRDVRGEPLPQEWGRNLDANTNGFHASDIVIAPSIAHAHAMTRVYGDGPAVWTIHNSSPETDCLNAGEPFVLAAARWWDEGKNARTLDAAAAQTRWPIVMAGALEGPGGAAVNIAYAKAPGPLSADVLAAQMRRAAIFVSPSRFEPFGLAALEAAHAGAALVLSDIPTYREIWGDAAEYASPTDAADLARALNKLIEDPDWRRELAARAALRARRFTPERQARRTLAAYAAGATLHAQKTHAARRTSPLMVV